MRTALSQTSSWMHRLSTARTTLRLCTSRPHLVRCSSTAATVPDAATKSTDAARGIASSLAQHLASPAVLKQLRTYGLCVIDRAFSGPAATVMGAGSAAPASDTSRSPACQSPLSARLRQEVLQLANKGLMRPNHTHLVVGGSGGEAQRSFVAKQAIMEADFAARPELLQPPQSPEQPSLSDNSRTFWRELVQSPEPISALNSQLSPRCTIASLTVKAQLNSGARGCFPLHFDTDVRVDARKLTAILYLNPQWQCATTSAEPPTATAEQLAAVAASPNSNAATTAPLHPTLESDGGSLRLYPFPHGALDISPIDERIVLFDSARMLHRVLPSIRPRACVSLWFWRELVQSPEPISALNSQLSPRCTIASLTVKAQLNSGARGCFPLHFDTDVRVDARKLTAILYLNPQWQCATTSAEPPTATAEQLAAVAASPNSNAATTAPLHPTLESDGGSLRLYPFPHGALDISPIDERIVLFDSARMLHRVLPSIRPRACVSLWFWQEDAQWKEQKTHPPPEDDPAFIAQQESFLRRIWPSASLQTLTALHTLLSSKLRVHWSKLFLRDAWFSSIEESHGESEERQSMLVRHLDESDQIQRALKPLLKLIPEQRGEGEEGERERHPHTDDRDDFREPWQRALPLPWSVPPTLPPFCSFVDAPPAAVSPAVAPAPAADQKPSRLVAWFE